MDQTLFLPFRLSGLNETTSANRTHWAKGAKLKKDEQAAVMWAIKAAKLKPVKNYPVDLSFNWREPNKRRDKDNIASAVKVVLDSLVKAGILHNDGWGEVGDWTNWFQVVDENEVGVFIHIFEGE